MKKLWLCNLHRQNAQKLASLVQRNITYKGKTISTPTPAITLRILKVVLMPAFRREITIPLNNDTLRLFSGTSCMQNRWLGNTPTLNHQDHLNSRHVFGMRFPLHHAQSSFQIEIFSIISYHKAVYVTHSSKFEPPSTTTWVINS